jgi:hypothetical protein
MQFNVAGEAYRVLLAAQPIFDDGGSELEGCAIEAKRAIVISPHLELSRREEIILHELSHAWFFHVPRPTNEEERSQIFATMARQFRADLESQGGDGAILNLRPTAIAWMGVGDTSAERPGRPQSAEAVGLSDRRVCGCCGAEVLPGSIVNTDISFHEPSRQWHIQRWFTCEGCGTLQAWREHCSADGWPSGVIVSNPPPRMRRGSEAAAWLADAARSAVL